MKRRGQTALEYLMTYGWALLIIAIVAIALWKLGVFSPASAEGVTRQPDKFIIDHKTLFLNATDGTLKFDLLNAAGDTVTIEKIDVYLGGKDASPEGTWTGPQDLSANAKQSFSVSLSGTYTEGQVYTFTVVITWQYQGTNINKTSEGIIAVRATS